jgi:hypothetical protein
MTAFAPTLRGIIDRRILVNFHVRPDVVRSWLPSSFRPQLVKGWAMAGICLIRLKNVRPSGFPAACGLASENAAHRIAVEWNEEDIICEGVFIPRRDTSSTLQAFAGGRFFPGKHHVARFDAAEGDGEYRLRMRSHDGVATVELRARRASKIPETSVFASLSEASEFFARGSIGYSATENPGCCDGLELRTVRWEVAPLDIEFVKSSFFDDQNRFPSGTIHFDCALLMENIEHEWHVLPRRERRIHEANPTEPVHR